MPEGRSFHPSGGAGGMSVYSGEDGWWVAECPSLPGCVSQGRTKEDALANIREAIAAYVEALAEDDLPVPVGPSRGTP
jgi:predicted RNase H-like HicB family nuclease